jgi:hypothetical protein
MDSNILFTWELSMDILRRHRGAPAFLESSLPMKQRLERDGNGTIVYFSAKKDGSQCLIHSRVENP